MMDSEEEEEQTALVCDNGKFRDSNIGCIGKGATHMDFMIKR